MPLKVMISIPEPANVNDTQNPRNTVAYFDSFEFRIVVINLFGLVSGDSYSCEYLCYDFIYYALK